MTPEERKLLEDTNRRARRVERILFERGADGDPPLIERIAATVKIAEHGELVMRWAVRWIVGFGAIAVAWAAFREELVKAFQWLVR